MDDTRDERTTPDGGTDDLVAGRRVGRYRLEHELGAGGMGVVWLATDPALKRRVAIKFLHNDAIGSLGEERFLREARAMAQVSHPCVVSVFDIGTADGRAFFAMEYVDGTTLSRWLSAEPRPWREVVELFIAAGRGLAAAHGARLVHRDFKPSNVLVGDARRVKVADFGIARPIGETGSPSEPLALTNPGAVAGTPGYMAPEVLAGGTVGPAADQYAFAISLRDALAPLRASSDVPVALDPIIERAVTIDESSRYPSLQVMLAELQHVLVPEGRRELSFGFPPTGPASAKREAAAELARYIAERYGLRLRASFAADYRGLVEDLVAGRLDVAWLPPLSVVRAERQARPVLLFERAGRGSYHGALVARRDSGLVGLADLGGKRVAWVDEDSAGGYVLARALIAERQRDVDAFLGPQRILGSHRAVVEAVLERTVDVGATFVNYHRDGSIAHSGWSEFLGERGNELGPIAITGAIPGDVIAVRPGLPGDEVDALIATLRDLASDPGGQPRLAEVFNGAAAFIEPTHREHDLLAKQAALAGWKP